MQVCIGEFWPVLSPLSWLGNLNFGAAYAICIPAYPRWKVDRLPRSKVSTFPWLLTPMMALRALNSSRLLNYQAITSFDRWMSSRIESCDVFHSLSSYAVLSHQAAKDRFGSLTICDRGSSHIRYQEKILAEEYDIQGIPFQRFDQRGIERELWEYEHCDLIVVPSTFAFRSFVEYGVPESRLRLNPFGADLNLFHPIPKRRRCFSGDICGATERAERYMLFTRGACNAQTTEV